MRVSTLLEMIKDLKPDDEIIGDIILKDDIKDYILRATNMKAEEITEEDIQHIFDYLLELDYHPSTDDIESYIREYYDKDNEK